MCGLRDCRRFFKTVKRKVGGQIPPDKITLCRNPPARTEPRGSYDLGEFCPGVGIGRSPERHADRRGIEGVSTANDNAL